MKILVFSDVHLDWVTHGVPRFDEINETLHSAVFQAAVGSVDLAMFLGDMCDPDSGPVVFRAVASMILLAQKLAVARIPSIWIAGNHDVIEDGSGATTLTPMAALMDERIHVHERPGVVSFSGLDILTLPYAPTSRPYDPEAVVKSFFASKERESRKTIVAGHLSVPGVVPGEEVTEMPRGREVVFPTKAAKRADLLLNGHYHRQQRTEDGILIPGSLARLTFGEEEHDPAFLIVEV